MHHMDAFLDPPHPDRQIAALAERQHGVVSGAQLQALGLGRGAIARRVQAGRLHRLHRGVYAVGHRRLTRQGRWMAAVLACGEGAALSHRSAAALWGIRRAAGDTVDISVPGRAGRARHAGIVVHRPRSLTDADRTERDAIPATTPARTLADLAAILTPPQLERAVTATEELRLFDLHAVAAAARGRPGSAALTRVLAAWTTVEVTRSELEDRFLALCHDHGLPRPGVNGLVHGYEVDFHWPAQRLVAEADSRRHHATRAAFETDRARDADLLVAGYRVVRFTYAQITDGHHATARTLRALLRR